MVARNTSEAPAATTGASALLLLLADGRFPAGGHAHSGGLEPAVAAGRVRDIATLESFLTGRAATSGYLAAAFAAAACARSFDDPGSHGTGESGPVESGPATFGGLVVLDTEFDARTPAPALRRASRSLGRQMLRAARAVCPHPGWETLAALPEGPHQPIVLGAAGGVLGLSPQAVATAALHEAATGPATAAIRLLGLDPFAVHAALARLGPQLDALAPEAAGYAGEPADRLPAPSAVMLDISAQVHTTWEVRLFAS